MITPALDSFLSFGLSSPSFAEAPISVSIQDFLVYPSTELIICPKFKSLSLPFSGYTLDYTYLTNTYSNLVYLFFEISVPLATRSSLRSYLLSHDPESYLLTIGEDLWRGFLINEEPRRKYFTSGQVSFKFELEYLGVR